MNDMTLVTLVITTACVLHNFTLIHEADSNEDATDDTSDANFTSDSAASEQLHVPSSKAVERRQELLMMLVWLNAGTDVIVSVVYDCQASVVL